MAAAIPAVERSWLVIPMVALLLLFVNDDKRVGAQRPRPPASFWKAPRPSFVRSPFGSRSSGDRRVLLVFRRGEVGRGVGARSTAEAIGPTSAGEGVGPGVAQQRIVAVPPAQEVVAPAAVEGVVAVTAGGKRRGCAMVRQGRLIAVVGAFLICCAVLLLAVGCSGTRSEAPKEKQQRHTEATNHEQTRLPEPTDSEEARCDRTRTIKLKHRGGLTSVTNDLPGCPNGGLLLGTGKPDYLESRNGDDEIRGLGGNDVLDGGPGSDVLYGGPGDDGALVGGPGEDVMHGGDGDDRIAATRVPGGDGGNGQRDEIYCGKGKDHYAADKNDYVDSSCEKKQNIPRLLGGGGA